MSGVTRNRAGCRKSLEVAAGTTSASNNALWGMRIVTSSVVVLFFKVLVLGLSGTIAGGAVLSFVVTGVS